MTLVLSFLMGGLLCTLFQIVHDVTKVKVPTLLLVGLILGGVLVPLGIPGLLAEYGHAGFIVMVVGAGQGVFNAAASVVHGDALGLVLSIGTFFVLALVGLGAGAVHWLLHRHEK